MTVSITLSVKQLDDVRDEYRRELGKALGVDDLAWPHLVALVRERSERRGGELAVALGVNRNFFDWEALLSLTRNRSGFLEVLTKERDSAKLLNTHHEVSLAVAMGLTPNGHPWAQLIEKVAVYKRLRPIDVDYLDRSKRTQTAINEALGIEGGRTWDELLAAIREVLAHKTPDCGHRHDLEKLANASAVADKLFILWGMPRFETWDSLYKEALHQKEVRVLLDSRLQKCIDNLSELMST